MTWLDNQIKDLEETNSKFKEQISKIKNVQPEIVNNFQEVTPLKLVVLDYYLKIYSAIISNYIKNNFSNLKINHLLLFAILLFCFFIYCDPRPISNFLF